MYVSRVLRNLRESVGIRENLLARLNIIWRPIVKQYREGKVKSMPVRQVKQNLKPCAYKTVTGLCRSSERNVRWRAYRRMIRRVIACSKVKQVIAEPQRKRV